MLRRCRSHHCGYSNIDFRTKQDDTSIKLYQPWLSPKQFGTMGVVDYKLPYDSKVKMFTPSKQLDSLKQYVSECPDPKYYSGCLFYQHNKIPVKRRMNLTLDKVSELDERVKGKDMFIGDSMMIAQSTKARKNYKQVLSLKVGEHQHQQQQQQQCKSKLICDKIINNKNASHETQLVSVNVKETLNGKVNVSKVKEIRRILKRKYLHKKDIKKVFRDWDLSINGEITLYDAYKMINSFGVPINYDETRTLISMVSSRNSDTLNLEEFTTLIRDNTTTTSNNNNNDIDIDLCKIPQRNANEYIEGETVEQLSKQMRISVLESHKRKQVTCLEQYLRIKVPKLKSIINTLIHQDNTCNSSSSNNNNNKELITFDIFNKALSQFVIPQRFYNEGIIKCLYDKHVDANTNLMNINTFSDNIMNDNDNGIQHLPTQEKERFLTHLEQKIIRSKSQIYSNTTVLQNEIQSKMNLRNEYLNDMNNRIKHERETNMKERVITSEINSMQPSKEFLVKTFGDRKQINETIDKIENEFFVPKIMMYNIQMKTRSGANPVPKNTFNEFQASSNSAMFISENDRFKIRSLNDKVDVVRKEKKEKEDKRNGRMNLIKKYNEMLKHKVEINELKKNQHELITELNKAERLYKYENDSKNNNDFVE